MWSLEQNLGQVRFNVVKNKETGILVVFSYFARGMQEVVVIEIPEWKLKAKLARNTIFEGN